MLSIPSRKQAPNQKSDHFFARLLRTFPAAYEPGKHLSSDKKDARFQGRIPINRG